MPHQRLRRDPSKSSSDHHKHVQKTVGLETLGSYETVLRTFDEFDANGDHLMNLQELHNLMVTLNKGNWTEEQTSILFAKVDRNNSGTIDVNEFVEYIFKRPDAMGGTGGMSDYEKVLEHFRRFDTNKNGVLDKGEFTRLMSTLKEGWTFKHTETVFAEVDKDNSGEVDSAELVAYIFGRSAERKGSRRSRRAKPLVVDIVCGKGGPEHQVEKLQRFWQEKFGESVLCNIKIEPQSRTITKVSACEGSVVFWDRSAMMAYREDPFETAESTKAFFEDLTRRQIQRLLASLQNY